MGSFQWYDAPALSHEDAVHIVLEGLDHRIDPRKCLWASYPANQDRLDLEERAEKEIEKLLKERKREAEEIAEEATVYASNHWFVGAPHFRVVKRGIPHLSVAVDLYLVVTLCSSFPEEDPGYVSEWGRVAPKAEHFEFPLALLDSLPQALAKGELEADGAVVLEKGEGETVYVFGGTEWRVPDAFLGFLWALAEKNMGLEGLVDSATFQVLQKARKALPQAAALGLPASAQNSPGEGEDVRDVQTVVSALTSLGIPKKQAEQAVAQAQFASAATLEEKIKTALQGLDK